MNGINQMNKDVAVWNLLADWEWLPTDDSVKRSLPTGELRVSVKVDTPAYLIGGGDASDFKCLSPDHGFALGIEKKICINTQLKTVFGSSVSLEVLEYDIDRNRIGETKLAVNKSYAIEFSDKTCFILLAFRMVGLEELTISEVLFRNADSVARTRFHQAISLAETRTTQLSSEDHWLSFGTDSIGAVEQISTVRSEAFFATAKNGANICLRYPFGHYLNGKAWEPNETLRLLMNSRIFDAGFYSAAKGKDFETDREAALDFLEEGMVNGSSCSPFIEVEGLKDEARDAWFAGDIAAVLMFLRQNRLVVGRLSSFFDASLIECRSNEGEKHPGGWLGWYLEHADPLGYLPSSEVSIRFDDFQRAVQAAAAHEMVSQRGRLDRVSRTWDHNAERDFKHSIVRQWRFGIQSEPKVSVIMPAWNRETSISSSIASVLNQSYENFELLVIDDGSTDNTVKTVGELAQQDSRVRILNQTHQGAASARNLGIRHARGRFLAFLDSDNLWSADFLETMIATSEINGYGFCYAGLSFDKGWGKRYRGFLGNGMDLAYRNHIDLNVVVVKKDLAEKVGGFDQSLRRWIDHDFILRLSRHVAPVFVPIIGCDYSDRNEDESRITNSEKNYWEWVVLAKQWANFDSLEEGRKSRERGRVSVVIPMYGHFELTKKSVEAVLKTSGSYDIETIVVDNGSAFDAAWRIEAVFASVPNVKVVRLPRNLNFAIGSNVGALEATGEFLFFLNNDTEVLDDWLGPLMRRLDDPQVSGVQPLLLFDDGSIQTAGVAFVAPDSPPVPFLQRLPQERAYSVSNLRFSAVSAAALLVRANDFFELGGFAPEYVNGMEDIDYCLRSVRETSGYFAVEPTSRVLHLESKTPGRRDNLTENRAVFLSTWRGKLPMPEKSLFLKAGFEVTSVFSDGREIPSPKVDLRAINNGALTWGIKFAAPFGKEGDKWGDTAFVESVQEALHRAGQQTTTYRHGANTDYRYMHDDVNLVIRGLDKVAPIPGKINILWVISHPELVTPNEILGFDLVYAASEFWARKMSEKSGVKIRTLLQATDPGRFNPQKFDPNKQGLPMFVGSVHPGRRRNVVETAISNQIPIHVIGKGWNQRLASDVLKAEFVKNTELGSVYGSAPIVFADHWGEMAQEGFIQNRVFDAVACGARVVSDEVPGLEKIFGNAVQVYETADELRYLCSPEGLKEFPSDKEMLELANNIVSNHSFDSRVSQMLEDINSIVSRH